MTDIPLVFIEIQRGELAAESLGLLAKARSLGDIVAAVICGPNANALATELHRYGADQVYVCEDAALDADFGQPYADAVAHLVEGNGYRTVLFATSTLSADVAAAVSVRMEAGLNWDLDDVTLDAGQLVGSRLALEDTLATEVGWTTQCRLAMFRPGLLEAVEHPVHATLESFEPAFSSFSLQPTVIERDLAPTGGRHIGAAEIIVAGGRGVRDESSLQLLEELAEVLNGAVCVSMPIVDRGWYPYANQVGQTGHSVKPRLYIACGISGALQHRVGMQNSGMIVAINTDPAAPIMGHCDIGVIGDLHTIVPQLTALILQSRQAA